MSLNPIMLISKLLDLGNKYIPDKDKRLEYEKSLAELEIQSYEAKKTLLERVIPVTFPLLVWILCLGLFSNVIAPWISLIFTCETPIYNVDPLHAEIIKFFLIGFFGKRTVEATVKKEL